MSILFCIFVDQRKNSNNPHSPTATSVKQHNMTYRAKITNIRAWIESHYNLNTMHTVKDAKDFYIELRDEDEAELIEKINRAQTTLLELTNEWFEKYNH